MLLACDDVDDRIAAFPTGRAWCPTCVHPVIAKCGPLIAWHWAHEKGEDCDPWAEPDTWWHHDWQSLVPPERREVPMGPHRADIVTPSGVVVELQTKSLPADQVARRERFYGRMVWIFDCREPVHRDRNGGPGLNLRNKGDHWTFRWKHARKSVLLPTRRVFLDVGDGVLELKRMYPGPPCGGWGYMRSYEEIQRALNRPAEKRIEGRAA